MADLLRKWGSWCEGNPPSSRNGSNPPQVVVKLMSERWVEKCPDDSEGQQMVLIGGSAWPPVGSAEPSQRGRFETFVEHYWFAAFCEWPGESWRLRRFRG